MNSQTRRVLRILFIIFGVITSLLGLVTLVMFLFFRPPGVESGTQAGPVIYLAIGVVSFVAARRLKSPIIEARGFEVIAKSKDDAPTR